MTALVQFDQRARWGATLVADGMIRTRLRAIGVEYGRWQAPPGGRFTPQLLRRELLTGLRRDDVQVRYVASGNALFYLPVERGWLGVLCEAGEWLMLPAQLRHAIDGGDEHAQVLRVQDTPGDAPGLALPTLPAGLPRHAQFREQLLAQMGESVTDAEASD